MLYVPIPIPVSGFSVPTGVPETSFQAKIYGAVAPATFNSIAALLSSSQLGAIILVVTIQTSGWAISKVCVCISPQAVVAVNV